jgi:hypothetical protein
MIKELREENERFQIRVFQLPATLRQRNGEQFQRMKSLEDCEKRNAAMTSGVKKCQVTVNELQKQIANLVEG